MYSGCTPLQTFWLDVFAVPLLWTFFDSRSFLLSHEKGPSLTSLLELMRKNFIKVLTEMIVRPIVACPTTGIMVSLGNYSLEDYCCIEKSPFYVSWQDVWMVVMHCYCRHIIYFFSCTHRLNIFASLWTFIP